MKRMFSTFTAVMLLTTTSVMAFGVENLKAEKLNVTVSKSSDASPDAIWAAIGKFCDITVWHPAIVKCVESKDGEDNFRTLSLDGGGEVYEKLISFDTAGKFYAYTIEKSPLPVQNYTARIGVKAYREGSEVTWSADFDAKDATNEKAIETMTGVFEAGVNSLVDLAKK